MAVKPGTIRKDLTGQTFGRLEVVYPDTYEPGKPRKWICNCECGRTKSIRGTALTSGKIVSCGCYNYENNQKDLGGRIGDGPMASKVQHLNEKKLSFKDFCAQYGLSPKIVRGRLRKGWTVDRALSTPVDGDIKKRNSRNRAKGRKLQQYVVQAVIDHFDGVLDEDDVREVPSSCSGVDVQLSKKGRRYFPVSIECKNTVDPPGKAAFEQADKNKYEETIPAVVWHPPNAKYEDSLAYIKFDDLLELTKKIRDAKVVI